MAGAFGISEGCGTCSIKDKGFKEICKWTGRLEVKQCTSARRKGQSPQIASCAHTAAFKADRPNEWRGQCSTICKKHAWSSFLCTQLTKPLEQISLVSEQQAAVIIWDTFEYCANHACLSSMQTRSFQSSFSKLIWMCSFTPKLWLRSQPHSKSSQRALTIQHERIEMFSQLLSQAN